MKSRAISLACCTKCGKEFSTHLESCPHCESNEKSFITNNDVTAFIALSTAIFFILKYSFDFILTKDLFINSNILEFVKRSDVNSEQYSLIPLLCILSTAITLYTSIIINTFKLKMHLFSRHSFKYKNNKIRKALKNKNVMHVLSKYLFTICAVISSMFLFKYILALFDMFYVFKILFFALTAVFTIIAIFFIIKRTENNLTRYTIVNIIVMTSIFVGININISFKESDTKEKPFEMVLLYESKEKLPLRILAVFDDKTLFLTKDKKRILIANHRIRSIEAETFTVLP